MPPSNGGAADRTRLVTSLPNATKIETSVLTAAKALPSASTMTLFSVFSGGCKASLYICIVLLVLCRWKLIYNFNTADIIRCV